MIIYLDHIDSLGNIYITPQAKGTFQKLVRLNENVNSSSLETSGSISADGEIIFFASDREGGFGGTDIYMCKKEPLSICRNGWMGN